MTELLRYCTPREKLLLYLSWVFSFGTGCVIPSFIFLLGPVFDAFQESEDADDRLKAVGKVVIIMGILALAVWLGSWLSYYN